MQLGARAWPPPTRATCTTADGVGHGQRRSVVILWAWTALLSAFVLYPVLTQSFISYVPIGAAMLGLLLYTSSTRRSVGIAAA